MSRDTGGIAIDVHPTMQVGLELPLEIVNAMVAVHVVQGDGIAGFAGSPHEENCSFRPQAAFRRCCIRVSCLFCAGLTTDHAGVFYR